MGGLLDVTEPRIRQSLVVQQRDAVALEEVRCLLGQRAEQPQGLGRAEFCCDHGALPLDEHGIRDPEPWRWRIIVRLGRERSCLIQSEERVAVIAQTGEGVRPVDGHVALGGRGAGQWSELVQQGQSQVSVVVAGVHVGHAAHGEDVEILGAALGRAARFLVGEAGIRQFLDIGTGIPSTGNVHDVAQRVAPGARVAYVDNDPIVHVHASALLTGDGDTSIVLADLREHETILAHRGVQALIDFGEPVALPLVAITHFITDEQDPAAIIAVLAEALAPGSYLVLSHGTTDFHPAATVGQAAAAYDRATAPLVLRSRARIITFFAGFDLIEPGLVQVPLWRPETKPPRDLRKIAIYGGVGRKPGGRAGGDPQLSAPT